MKKKITSFGVMALLFGGAYGQIITKTSSSSVSGTVCPNITTFYEVSVPDGFQTCIITWSANNGVVTRDASDQRKARVVWNDISGASGTVTATFNSCTGNSTANGKSASKSELILSVKGRNFESYPSSINIDYCTKNQVLIPVSPMVVQGTGGIAQPPRTEVHYLWKIPVTWREVGTGRTGEFGTSASSILIEPIDCATRGVVTVKGVLNDASLCPSAETSNSASITLNGTDAVVTVVPQAGYTGASACSTTPVTFYAYANVGCVNAYSWTKPSSWTEVSRNGNSITLKPSGTLADVADIKATITFTCGSTVNGTFKPQFNNPIISTPSAICYSGTTVSLTNVGPGTSVLWTTGSNMSILSGNGTPTINVRAISAITRETGIIQASVSCSDAQVPA